MNHKANGLLLPHTWSDLCGRLLLRLYKRGVQIRITVRVYTHQQNLAILQLYIALALMFTLLFSTFCHFKGKNRGGVLFLSNYLAEKSALLEFI